MNFNKLTVVLAAKSFTSKTARQASWLRKIMHGVELKIIVSEVANQTGDFDVVLDESRGVYAAYNTGLNHATRNYIFFLGESDYVTLNGRRELFSFLESENSEISCFAFGSAWYAGNRLLNTGEIRIDESWDLPGALKGMPVSHQSLVVKRSLLSSLGGFDEGLTIAADFNVVCQLISMNFNVKYSPTIFSLVDKTGISSLNPDKVIYEYTQVLSRLFPHVDPGILKAYFLASNYWGPLPRGDLYHEEMNKLMMTVQSRPKIGSGRDRCRIIWHRAQ